MYHLKLCENPIRYEEGLSIQKEAYDLVRSGKSDGVLIVLEHTPVYTVGTNGGWDNFLVTEDSLKQQGVDVVSVNRGGNVTFHGPGQVVVYPIFNLNKLQKDVHWFITCLEQVVINVLSDYGIEGTRKPEYRGVWIGDRKVSAVGVHVKRWITTHGLSMNLGVDKKYFSWINPCGITEFGVSSMEDYIQDIQKEKVRKQLIYQFETVFQINLEHKIERNE